MNKSDKKLLDIYTELDEDDQNSLLSYAQFLLQKAQQDGRCRAEELQLIVDIPRPKEEKVVAAIKRLSATYPMLEKDHLMNETASLMSEHLLQGCSAVEVIDKLEIVFETHYEKLKLKIEQ